MSYTTYYTSAAGQAPQGELPHLHFDSALLAWQADCGALLPNGGGRAMLIDSDADVVLQWIEGRRHGYVAGRAVHEHLANVDALDLDSPDKVLALLRGIVV